MADVTNDLAEENDDELTGESGLYCRFRGRSMISSGRLI
jgi:hypothetical protein